MILAGDVQPIVAEGKIFFGACNGDFYALDAQTGRELWRKKLGGQSFMYSWPMVHQGLVMTFVMVPDGLSEFKMEKELDALSPREKNESRADYAARIWPQERATIRRWLAENPMQQRFTTEAVKLIQAGTSFETFRRNAHLAYSGKPDWFRGSDGIAFALFYLTREVARYINEQSDLKRAMERYVDQAVAVWPLWWMAQAPVGDGGYFDEGSCAGPETRMMLFNYFAWVRQKPAKELRLLVDVPDALIGDCYYLQNLVTAIESLGQSRWH